MERRIPAAAKQMTRDEPPAGDEGSGEAGDRQNCQNDPDVVNAW